MGKLFHYFYNKGIKVDEYSTADKTLVVTASDESVDRYNEIMRIGKGKKDGALLENYNKNKIHLWNHNIREALPPIAKGMWAKKVNIEQKGKEMRALRVKLLFMPNDFSMSIHWMHTHPEDTDDKFLNGISIGFLPLTSRYGDELTEEERELAVGRVYDLWDLLETSSVPIPCNPNALSDAFKSGQIPESIYREFMLKSYKDDPIVHYKTFIIGDGVPEKSEETEDDEEIKGVIPYKKHSKAPEDTKWDGPGEVRKAEVKELKVICTWFDSENADAKGSYKLPHHKADGYATVWKGVAAAMGALLGARGGTKIPDSDRKGCYNHLSKHYKDFDKDVPEFKEYSEEELKILEEEEFISLDKEPEDKSKGGFFVKGSDLEETFGEEIALKVIKGELGMSDALDEYEKQQKNQETDNDEMDIELDEEDENIDLEDIEVEEKDSQPLENSDEDIPISNEDVDKLITSVKKDLVGEFRKKYKKEILGIVEDPKL